MDCIWILLCEKYCLNPAGGGKATLALDALCVNMSSYMLFKKPLKYKL